MMEEEEEEEELPSLGMLLKPNPSTEDTDAERL